MGKENKKPEQSKEEGKYAELEGAEKGKVVVRFPPEASGYLHIGHAKAALLNQYYQLAFEGKLVFRFDDTNPEKEKEDFEHVITEDVDLLKIKPDLCSYTSDHFELLLQKIEQLLREGKAYVDDTPAEQMKLEREQRQESKNRNNTVETNFEKWEQMKAGTEYGQTCCVRAKLNMKSDNGCLRDPTFYRCKPQPHPRTGYKYNVYPTYDFACPIVDSIEGITHALRTTEYGDRDPQFMWVLEALQMRKPYIYAYSRLNMTHTVLSKRKLTWFVENNHVTGWDDPRMPTVRGILRRGLTVEGLKQFIIAQGSSRAVVFMEWDKIWSFNRKVIDPIAVRYMGIEAENSVPVQMSNVQDKNIEVDCHPKIVELGKRSMSLSENLLIDQTDATQIQENSFVTFIHLGNALINSVTRDPTTGFVTSIKATLDPNNKDFRKTLKVTWLDAKNVAPASCFYYENLITKPILGPEDEFKDYINKESKVEVKFLVEKQMENLTKSSIIQILRKGFFICDQQFNESTKIELISIPDGSADLKSYPKVVQETKQKFRDTAALFAVAKKNAKEAPKTVTAGGDEIAVYDQVRKQGDLVRDLKSKKAEKAQVEAAVKTLLELKAKYKSEFGKDYNPNQPPKPSSNLNESALDILIKEQGEKIRKLKATKPSKEALQPEIDQLLKLKAEFKKLAGKDWTPSASVPTSSAISPEEAAIDAKIKEQGEKIRKLKGDKVAKEVLQPEIDQLLKLKAEFKKLAGKDWAPSASVPTSSAISPEEAAIDAKIKEQGEKIRKLKGDKVAKEVLQPEIDQLLKLKTEYKNKTGKDWNPPASVPAPRSKQEPKPKESKPKEQKPKEQKAKDSKPIPTKVAGKKQTRLCIETKKKENFADWYTEVITKSEMLEYYDISGCYILRPWAFSIWEKIVSFFDTKIKEIGVSNVSFPMFVSASALEKEKDHIADFAPEVAWVTKSGSSDLAEPIAIRPTSETVMYPSYSKWIKSHRDLPLKLNQWCNVVRWEFKDPTPFLRSREFLWQEGHTAHATKEEAIEMVNSALSFYAQVYEDLLAIPVVKGRKTENEKFPGGDMTTTVEGFISSNGRGIQAATSHFLGQNFSKMFDISFEDGNGSKQLAYQTSWGLTTRSIGVMVMEHSDDQGLVLPPRVAPIQVVIIPCGITTSTSAEEKRLLLDVAQQLEQQIKSLQIRTKLDDDEHNSPGWKYNHWELKGVPVRIELGPKDLAKGEFVTARRDTSAKNSYAITSIAQTLPALLNEIQSNLLNKARAKRDAQLKIVHSMDEFINQLNQKCILLAPFCGDKECEESIKKQSAKNDSNEGPLMGAKSLCIPFEQPTELKSDACCVNPNCVLKPKNYTLFGRSY